MNTINSLLQKIRNWMRIAIRRFPIVVLLGTLFTMVVLVRITIDVEWERQVTALFSSLLYALGVGVCFGLLMTTFTLVQKKKSILFVSGLTFLVTLCSFLYLFFLEKTQNEGYETLTSLGTTRMVLIMGSCFLLFILVTGKDSQKQEGKPASALFLLEKVFVIAGLYSVVFMGGASIVALAIQGLLYQNMPTLVYEYIVTLSGYLAFLFCLGGLPYYGEEGEKARDQREQLEEQPKFIVILFGNILVPVLLALTVVLLLWVAKIVWLKEMEEFSLLTSIGAIYTLGGIWLYLMTFHQKEKLPLFYRKVFPFAGILILCGMFYALIHQLITNGLSTNEYVFVLIWILAMAAMLLFLFQQAKSQTYLFLLGAVLFVISGLPFLGYHALPVRMQSNRLTSLLQEQGMLQESVILPADQATITKEKREKITHSAMFLGYAKDAKLPAYLPENIEDEAVFLSTMGFEPEYAYQSSLDNGEYQFLVLMAKANAMDITGYRWGINLEDEMQELPQVELESDLFSYSMKWDEKEGVSPPVFTLSKEGRVMIEASMEPFLKQLLEKYPPSIKDQIQPDASEMQLVLYGEGVEVLLVFDRIEVSTSMGSSHYYWMDLDTVYMKEVEEP